MIFFLIFHIYLFFNYLYRPGYQSLKEPLDCLFLFVFSSTYSSIVPYTFGLHVFLCKKKYQSELLRIWGIGKDHVLLIPFPACSN